MDIRIKQSFPPINMFPALGLFSVFIAKKFCYLCQAIEYNFICNDFLSIIMLYLLFFDISIYLVSFLLFPIGKNLSNDFNGMLEICCHN